MEDNITTTKKNLSKGVFKWDNTTSNTNQRLYLTMRMRGFETISTFASFLGFSRSFISKIMHRKIKPTIDDAERIAFKLGLRLKDLFDASDLRIPEIDNLVKIRGEKND